jgi:Skp family chaperone for outer membrane proteins
MNTQSSIAGRYIRYSIICLSIGLAITMPLTASGQQSPKIGVVDFREVALGSKAGKAVKARLEKLADKLKKEVQAEEAKLLARRKELEVTTTRLAPAERQERATTLERDEAAFQRLIEDKSEELRNAEAKNLQELAGQIERIVKAYATEKGFSVILEAQRPGVLYFNKNLDLSAEIIKRFDRTSK